MKEFLADVFLVPSQTSKLLNVSIRGQFLDVTSNVIYFFHRVFLLAPPSEQQPQWPALILNDQLTIVHLTATASQPPQIMTA